MKFKFFKRRARQQHQVPQNPEVILGGSAPVGPADSVAEPAWHKAAMTLGSNHIRIIWTLHQGQIWFIAAREAEFQGTGAFTSRLIAALPGHRDHRGDGAYLDSSGERHALALVREGKIAICTGAREHLEREAERAGLLVYEVDPSASAPWVLFEQYTQAQSWSRLSNLAWGGAAVFLVGMGLAVLALFQHQANLIRTERAHIKQNQWKQSITAQLDTALAMPLTDQRMRLRDAENVAISTGGVLTFWKLTNHQVQFKAVLPSYVRPIDYSALGSPAQLTNVGEYVEVASPLAEIKK